MQVSHGLRIQKYGGTSLGTPEKIRKVAQRIAQTRKQAIPLVVVVSAMGHTTDELQKLAGEITERPPAREMDMLLTAGERISMALLSIALHKEGVEAVSLTGSQCGIVTDGSHRRARIDRILADRVRQNLTQNRVVIVAGFQGISPEKEITTLGRGGSDTTAVALAIALNAEVCEIYTDVDGIYSAHPEWVKNPVFHSYLPYDHVLELTLHGSQVLHFRSVELARKYGIVLQVLNSHAASSEESQKRAQGTQIMTREEVLQKTGLEHMKITGVSVHEELMLLEVELERPTVLPALWTAVEKENLQVVSPVFSESKVCFYVERHCEEEWKKHLGRLVTEGFIKQFRFESAWVPLTVVGDCFSEQGSSLSRVIETLQDHHVPVRLGFSGAASATVAISQTHSREAVQALHDVFFSEANAKAGIRELSRV